MYFKTLGEFRSFTPYICVEDFAEMPSISFLCTIVSGLFAVVNY